MSRAHHRMFISAEVIKIRDALAEIREGKRLHVIAEALMELNDYKPREERTQQASCGCYDWDIAMDYRPHHERYPEQYKEKDEK